LDLPLLLFIVAMLFNMMLNLHKLFGTKFLKI